MKIALAAALSIDNQVELNLLTMEHKVSEARRKEADLILFGQAYLQGFDAISFNYEKDIKETALGIYSPEITKVRKLAKDHDIAIAFGFYENDHGGIFASYLVIGPKGEDLAKYQRISAGWKIPRANAEYRQGKEFATFDYRNKHFTVMLCGDFWEDDLLEDIVKLDPHTDAFLWPVYCDYSIKEWQEEAHTDYRKRSQILANKIFFINSLGQGEKKAKGGAYVWQQGRELASLEPGKQGLLYYNLS